jgi:hypothetical protein
MEFPAPTPSPRRLTRVWARRSRSPRRSSLNFPRSVSATTSRPAACSPRRRPTICESPWPLSRTVPHVSTLSRPGTRPGIRPVIRDNQQRNRLCCLAFLSPFGHRHSLLGHPAPARELGPSYDRLTGLPNDTPDPDEVSMFRTHETRLGWSALFTPGTTVFTRPERCPRPPSAAFQRPVPTTPVVLSIPGCLCHEASSRIQDRSPVQPSLRL